MKKNSPSNNNNVVSSYDKTDIKSAKTTNEKSYYDNTNQLLVSKRIIRQSDDRTRNNKQIDKQLKYKLTRYNIFKEELPQLDDEIIKEYVDDSTTWEKNFEEAKEELQKIQEEKNRLERKNEKLHSREEELYAGQKIIAKDAYYSSKAEITQDKYNNYCKEFAICEKIDLSDKLKNQINNVPRGQRGNYRVQEPEKIKGVAISAEDKVIILENWKPNSDGSKPGTRHMEIVRAIGDDGKQTLIDRIGGANGNYFSPMNPQGEPYTLIERGIGDYLPEKNIQDNDSYHLYAVKQDFTRENFEKAIKNTYDEDKQNQMLKELNAYYEDSIDTEAKNHFGEKYCTYSIDEADGVKARVIDQMFLENGNSYGKMPDGGGNQIILPFPEYVLKEIGMIVEVNIGDEYNDN